MKSTLQAFCVIFHASHYHFYLYCIHFKPLHFDKTVCMTPGRIMFTLQMSQPGKSLSRDCAIPFLKYLKTAYML